MKRDRIRPLYAHLTEPERFRLSIRLGARGDEQEALYLVRAAPTDEFEAVNPDFARPVMASFRLASAFARAAGPYLGWVNAVGMLEGLLTGDRGRALLARDAQLPVSMVLDHAVEGAARDLRALIDAFEEVCRERAGLSGQVLLRFWVPEVAALLEASNQWVPDLDADAGTREGFKAGLDQAWTLSLPSKED